nr:L-arabinokinase isoform X2 [Tanacetum cinerariifolium]
MEKQKHDQGKGYSLGLTIAPESLSITGNLILLFKGFNPVNKCCGYAQAQQHAKGQGPTPVIQIVSYGSEMSNRGPTFDMDMLNFMDGDQPI